MSVRLRLDNKEVLYVSRGVFENLYGSLSSLESFNYKNNDNVRNLINELEIGIYGFGIDLAVFFTNKDDVIIFANLLNKTIGDVEEQYSDLPEVIKKELWNFHKTILEYAKTLQP